MYVKDVLNDLDSRVSKIESEKDPKPNDNLKKLNAPRDELEIIRAQVDRITDYLFGPQRDKSNVIDNRHEKKHPDQSGSMTKMMHGMEEI